MSGEDVVFAARRQMRESRVTVRDHIAIAVLQAAIDVVMIIKVAAVHVRKAVIIEMPVISEPAGAEKVMMKTVVPEPERAPVKSKAIVPAIIPGVEARAVTPRERPGVIHRSIPVGITVIGSVDDGRAVDIGAGVTGQVTD